MFETSSIPALYRQRPIPRAEIDARTCARIHGRTQYGYANTRAMTEDELKTRLRRELPALLREDAAFRAWLEEVIRDTAVPRTAFDERIDRKVQFYDRRHQRPVQRRIVVSPMVHPSARPVAEALGIEVFAYAADTSGL
jgi:hypothetical protein